MEWCAGAASIFLRLILCQLLHLILFSPILWKGQWHPTPVLLPGKSHGWRSLVVCILKVVFVSFLAPLHSVSYTAARLSPLNAMLLISLLFSVPNSIFLFHSKQRSLSKPLLIWGLLWPYWLKKFCLLNFYPSITHPFYPFYNLFLCIIVIFSPCVISLCMLFILVCVIKSRLSNICWINNQFLVMCRLFLPPLYRRGKKKVQTG